MFWNQDEGEVEVMNRDKKHQIILNITSWWILITSGIFHVFVVGLILVTLYKGILT